MIDVKKLITGFLILACAAIGSGLILSFVDSSFSTPKTPTAASITIGGSDAALATNNAFLPTQDQVNQIIAAVAPDLASSSMLVSSTDPNNLTEVLAANFVNGMVAANPNGPTTNSSNGNPVYSTPDISAIAADVANTTTTKNLKIPDWDVEANSIPVTVVSSNSEKLTSYGTAVNDILSKHLNEQVQSIVSGQTDSASANDLAYTQTQVQNALKDTASLKVPTPAAAYQKSLLTELVYQKNLLKLYDLAQTDPVKASVLFQEEDQKFAAVHQNLLDQAQTLTNNTLSLEKVPQQKHGDILLSFINNTFSIPQAHAMWPVFDPATWGLIESNQAVNIGRELEAILKNTLLQILKNTLMAIVQTKVLTWVQGSGAPRFITNWGTTLINSAQTSALNALNEELASCEVYSGFSPQISVTLKSLYYTGNTAKNACANQFASALGSNSLQQFYNNFANGGFVAFGASTLPSGNPYGSTFFAAQKTDLAYKNSQAATSLKTQTSGGFKGGESCDDGSDPNDGEHTVCENPDGVNYTIQGSEQCGPGDKQETYANSGVCDDGSQPVVTTPAAVTGFALNSGVDATSKQISAANDITGLLNSVLSSLITSLASTAVNAAGKLVSQGLSSINSSNITAGATTAAPAAIALACNPTTQTIPSPSATSNPTTGATTTSTIPSPASLSATGGTTDSNGNAPSYFWSDTNGASSTGSLFSDTFLTPGSYTITLTDSTGDSPVTCTVIQQ